MNKSKYNRTSLRKRRERGGGGWVRDCRGVLLTSQLNLVNSLIILSNIIMISLSIGDKLAIYFLHSPCILSWRRLIPFHSFWNPCDHLPHPPPPPTSGSRQAIDNHCSLRMSRFLELKSIYLMKQNSSSANFPSLFSNQCTVFWFPWHFHGVPPMYHKRTLIYLTWTCSFCSLFSI